MRHIFLIVIFICSACEMGVEIDVPKEKPKLTLNSYFTTDSLWVARVTLSRYILEDDYNYDDVKNALVVIYQNNIALDTLEHDGYQSYVSKNNRPVNNGLYEIRVKAEGYESVSASSFIPLAVPIENVEVTGAENNYTVKVKFQERLGEENFYIIKAEMEETKIDNQTGKTYVARSPIYLESDDPLFNGEDYYYDGFIFGDGLIADKAVSLVFKTSQFLPEDSKLIIYLRTLSSDLYKYQITYDLQQTTSGDPFAQPVSVYNNINKGYGIFAGYSEFTYVVNN